MTKSVLVYARPWNVATLTSVATQAFGGATVLSDHRSIDSSGLCAEYKKLVGLARRDVRSIDVDSPTFDEHETIHRCRLLRSIDQRTALLHVRAMRLALTRAFDREEPTLVFSQCVDNFVVDLLARESRRRGVPFVGIVPSFINGHFRITTYGEPNQVRPPSQSGRAAEAVCQQLTTARRPAMLGRRRRSQLESQVLLQMRSLYYKGWRVLQRDRDNYHAWLNATRAGVEHTARLKENADWRSEAKNRTDVSCWYFPLQVFPEATIDYWAPKLALVDYYRVAESLIDRFDGDVLFLVKGHPGAVARLPRKFVGYLTASPNVLIVPAGVPSHEIFGEVDATLTWTGSAGFESAFAGVPALTVAEPYYMFDSPLFPRLQVDVPSMLTLQSIESGLGVDLSEQQREMCTYLGSMLVEGAVPLSRSQVDGADLRAVALRLRDAVCFMQDTGE